MAKHVFKTEKSPQWVMRRDVCFRVRNVLVHTADSQAGHTEMRESISDKHKQTNKARPARDWERFHCVR